MMELENVKKELLEKIGEYLSYAKGLSTADDIQKLLSEKKYNELEKIMMTRLAFGTAGLRGHMGPGYAAMNDLVIVQTTQGLVSYLETIYKQNDKMKGVVIGFDNRHNSQRFAHLAAVSFLLKEFTVYIFSAMIPTPFVPYAVKKLNCLVGIMVTASHNPKDDNGYKVYWSNGVQILPPHDVHIQESILQNLKPWDYAFDTSLVWVSNLAYDPLPDIEQNYYTDLINYVTNPSIFTSCPDKITFTAMHGVSHSYMKKAFQKLGYKNYVAVKEQMYPDPNFPTVVFPNPEEKNCLDLAILTANSNHSRLILANDPDVDRLAVAEKLPSNEWHLYTGNEIGAVLAFWMWKNYIAVPGASHEKACMISSAVSSKILRSMSEKEGFTFYETLTGFKWMANKAYDAMKAGMEFLFAFEEAIGYMCGPMVLDKDGIHAAIQIASVALSAYSGNKALYDILRESYLTYGYHVSSNSYYICYDPDVIKAMFNRIRNYNGTKQYPETLDDDNHRHSYPIKGVRDLTTGYDSRQPDKCPVLPISKITQMITFYFANGCEATIRTSGTEPKVKYYAEIIANEPESNWKDIDSLLKTMVDLIIAKWIQPTKNGFLNRP